ncbi:transcriptional regulator, LacI family [Pilibacter termitis]|uniref:Transcriptional regulator, LacI family n=1 Tax=Pilibacter termitis TaxID=263852 RepID=A0A1T4RA52_9ENTE|nr:LacI family DNA-binding transcriptional regulator [Pilibacter termitis]SKA12853.1 transcriptional regulator, LacI family [Pilibacter termitis]
MKKITIKDVAKAAGVSVSAVSRVFNDYEDISTETKEKVLQVAKQLKYVPNSAARHLSAKNKKTIALILNEINVTRGVAMPLEILSAVIDYLDRTEYEFVLYATNTKKQKEKTLFQFCNEHDITGILIQGLRVGDPYYLELKTFDLPTVALELDIENEKVGKVSTDNEKAAMEVTQYLQDIGYKKILFINGRKGAAVSIAREKGYRCAVETPHIIYADYDEEIAYKKTLELLEDLQFDAIFAASDMMAIGVIKALRTKKLEKKIAVVGFDDITLASYITPSLTTIRQNIPKIATDATKDLIRLIEKKVVKNRFVPYELIIRESTPEKE